MCDPPHVPTRSCSIARTHAPPTHTHPSPNQVDLIDMQSCMDGQFSFLLSYKDDGAKIYANAALTSKSSMCHVGGVRPVVYLRHHRPAWHPGGADNGREFSGVASSSTEGRPNKKTKKGVVEGTDAQLTDEVPPIGDGRCVTPAPCRAMLESWELALCSCRSPL